MGCNSNESSITAFKDGTPSQYCSHTRNTPFVIATDSFQKLVHSACAKYCDAAAMSRQILMYCGGGVTISALQL